MPVIRVILRIILIFNLVQLKQQNWWKKETKEWLNFLNVSSIPYCFTLKFSACMQFKTLQYIVYWVSFHKEISQDEDGWKIKCSIRRTIHFNLMNWIFIQLLNCTREHSLFVYYIIIPHYIKVVWLVNYGHVIFNRKFISQECNSTNTISLWRLQ
jgi:hypothetical protein